MEFVLDANVIISAIIKDSHVRHFLLFSGNSFCTPEFVFEEINEHRDEIKEKSSLSEKEIKELLHYITAFANLRIIPLVELESHRTEAIRISPDPDDIHYVALALKRNCAIWSNDRALKEKQSVVRVYNSEQVLKMK